MQWNLSRVLDAMPGANGNIRGLILFEQKYVFSARDARSAGNHNPVLRTMMMQLQRHFRARLHFQTLHLKAWAARNAVVAAPGTENLAMQGVLIAAEGFQPADEFLHVL